MATFVGNGLRSASVGRLGSYANSELNKKVVVENFFFVTACDSCFFAQKENNMLERHRWQFLTSDPRFKVYMGLQCQENHEHVWKQTSEGKREYPSAMVRRLVTGPPQLLMYWSETDRILSSSPAVFVASSAQESE